jgi:hypothetical protein
MDLSFADTPDMPATHRANMRKQLRAHFLVLAQGWHATPPNIIDNGCTALHGVGLQALCLGCGLITWYI